MGAWGTGNLENDGAQDLLGEISDDLFRRVMAALKSKHGHEYDELEHCELFVLIEMLMALHARGMVNSSPEPGALKPLFPPFLERWADYHRKAGHDVPAERRRVIEQSFEALVEIASTAQVGSFAHRLGLISDVMSKPRADGA